MGHKEASLLFFSFLFASGLAREQSRASGWLYAEGLVTQKWAEELGFLEVAAVTEADILAEEPLEPEPKEEARLPADASGRGSSGWMDGQRFLGRVRTLVVMIELFT
jgi:hypothetical protein